MSDERIRVLLQQEIDGMNSDAERDELRILLESDAEARRTMEELRRIGELLRNAPEIKSPSYLTPTILNRLAAEYGIGTGRTAEQKSRPSFITFQSILEGVMKKNLLYTGIGFVLVIAIYIAFIYPWPAINETQGTIGAVKKYRSDQISDKDVVLDGQSASGSISQNGTGAGAQLGRQAELFRSMPLDKQAELYRSMPLDKQAELFRSMPLDKQAELYRSMPLDKQAELYRSMPLDKQAELYRSLPIEKQAELYRSMPLDKQAQNQVDKSAQNQLDKAASLFRSMPLDKQAELFRSMPLDKQAELYRSMPLDKQAELYRSVPLDKQADLFRSMPLDKTAELFRSMPLDKQAELFRSMPLDKQAELSRTVNTLDKSANSQQP